MVDKVCKYCDYGCPDGNSWKNGVLTVWRCSCDKHKVNEMQETCDQWCCGNPY